MFDFPALERLREILLLADTEMPPHEPVVSAKQAQCFAEIIDFEERYLSTPKLPLTALVVAKTREMLRVGLVNRMPEMVLIRLTVAIAQAEHDASRAPATQVQW